MRIWGRAEARQTIDDYERAEIAAWMREVVAAIDRTALVQAIPEPTVDPRVVAEVA